ncbi:MAG: DNA ligase (ATP) [Alyxoria varia]|nr:MAG: DNA ligase (ATP) [Alyxoria varia]
MANPPSLDTANQQRYPIRPHNHGNTLPFHSLFTDLFNPLNDNKKKPPVSHLARRKQGPHGPNALKPHEQRRAIIEHFIDKWRAEVGNDIWPAFRLILPDKDRERPMFGLKEKLIAKLLVRCMGIDKNSQDGLNLLNWKLPGQKAGASMAGDFGGRCYEVLVKRAMRSEVGRMTVAEVNDQLDQLAYAQREEQQFRIMESFYKRMNSEELMWLIRMILKQLKIGVTEKTILDIWHPDAETLFNVSSNLRRVCWELHDPAVRLHGEETDISLMSCFQPQLAQFQMPSFQKMVQKLQPQEDDDVFWVEEKLDGERMQLHMIEDENHPGGKRFRFWSRKAKDYTYLYGNGFEDEQGALTRHLRNAFVDECRNVILDGEMVTWDMDTNKIVEFGTLKTAAIKQQSNPYESSQRPVFKVFDILYLNDQALTNFTLRDRRKALEHVLMDVHRRIEIHEYKEARSAKDIEPLLLQIVAESSEGLVLKNPRSAYKLNERNDDWLKVKPEYMTELSDSLDCVIIGGYFGSGKRGGAHSSYLCGLRVDQAHINDGADPIQCHSFCRVGGGYSASDYAAIRHRTEGKWHPWDPKNPPSKYIQLGGAPAQLERPDEWIRPDESVVISVKAASVHNTVQFRMGVTLRFPRFKGLRTDKSWQNALSIKEFWTLNNNVEQQRQNKLNFEQQKRKKQRTSRKREFVVAGAPANEHERALFEGGSENFTNVFAGLTLCIMTDAISKGHERQTKLELEALAKQHGANLTQNPRQSEEVICVADRKAVKVASLQNEFQKEQARSIVRPSWVMDCVKQAERDIGIGVAASAPRSTENGTYSKASLGQSSFPQLQPPLLLPFEPRHAFFVAEKDQAMIGDAADAYGDSFARDIASVGEMRKLLEEIPAKFEDHSTLDPSKFVDELEDRNVFGADSADGLRGWMFRRVHAWVDSGKDEGQPGGTMNSTSHDDSVKIKEEGYDAGTKTLATGTPMDIDTPSDQAPAEPRKGDKIPNTELVEASRILQFGGASLLRCSLERLRSSRKIDDITHAVSNAADSSRKREIRDAFVSREAGRYSGKDEASRVPKMPWVVAPEWVTASWDEATWLDEERTSFQLAVASDNEKSGLSQPPNSETNRVAPATGHKDLASQQSAYYKCDNPQLAKRVDSSEDSFHTASSPLFDASSTESSSTPLHREPFVWLERANFPVSYFLNVPNRDLRSAMTELMKQWFEGAAAGVTSRLEGLDEEERKAWRMPYRVFRTQRCREGFISPEFIYRWVWINTTGQSWPWLTYGLDPLDVPVVRNPTDDIRQAPKLKKWFTDRILRSRFTSKMSGIVELNLRDDQGQGVFGFSYHIEPAGENDPFFETTARFDALRDWGAPQGPSSLSVGPLLSPKEPQRPRTRRGRRMGYFDNPAPGGGQ